MQNLTAANIDGDFSSSVISVTEKSQIVRACHWLTALSITTIVMMLIGAVTRLTGSGLSIPEWPLINGSLMYPLTDADWTAVFETYKQFPQYHILNSTMSLNEFKFIFFFEYFHRSITTAISLLLCISSVKILVIKAIRPQFLKHVGILFFLLILQALAGYYMVKSGLQEGQASVSQYRLMIHLTLAFTFLSTILWTLWSLLNVGNKPVVNKITKTVYFLSYTMLGLIIVQLMSGALVAGTKAGFQFNDWPFMAGQLFPENLISVNGQFADNLWLNFTENIITIQFVHRNIAYLLTVFAIIFIFYSKKCNLNHRSQLAVNVLAITLASQVVLGIVTLMMHVPITLGALHQLGAILLFVNILYIFFKLRNYEIIDN
ncbi:MAG: COX15/CtaA family protein [Calditrichaeota bacterium]|nr:COX15/CtaA family protein [Calditrichota bacterium]